MYSELIKYLKDNGIRTTNDGGEDQRLHADEMCNWGAKTKREYQSACKKIDKIGSKGNGWIVYAWYDISSYSYWMKDMCEQNYIQVTISFDSANVPESEFKAIYRALDSAIADAMIIAETYNYNPDPNFQY